MQNFSTLVPATRKICKMLSFPVSFVKSLRNVTYFTVVCIFLYGCGLAQKHIDPALKFDPSNDKAVVIGGVDITDNKDGAVPDN